MHEALAMARFLRDLLNKTTAKDGGAGYQVVVTDVAGNSAEVRYEAQYQRWVMDDGVSLDQLMPRLRFTRLPGGRSWTPPRAE